MFTSILLHYFFHIEYLRAEIEDSAFDLMSTFVFSKEEVDTKGANTFILLVDDKYLKSKNLLDENNETKYGYIFPRNYISDIIANIDELVSDLDEENYPDALFVDYDTTYLSDPHNKTATEDDIRLLNILKKQRPYIIYLPLTSNYNFIYHSQDDDIQKSIKNGKIRFVSTGITSSNDGISRRYYPYEIYKDINNKDKKFLHISIELYNLQNPTHRLVKKYFALNKESFIENRIIFKDMFLQENTSEYNYWQSKWKKLAAMSANYPLDNIYEESLRHAVIMLGAGHSASQDKFEIDDYLKEISGVEMHANAFMTLKYLDGKLRHFSIIKEVFTVFSVVFIIAFLLTYCLKTFFLRLERKIKMICNDLLRNFFTTIVSDETERVFLFSTIAFFIISFVLLKEEHLWFNWMIPLIAYFPYKLLNWLENKLFSKN